MDLGIVLLGFILFLVYLIIYAFWKLLKKLHVSSELLSNFNTSFEQAQKDADEFLLLLSSENSKYVDIDKDFENGKVYVELCKGGFELILTFKGNGQIVYSGIFDSDITREGSCCGSLFNFKNSIPPVLEPLLKRFV